MSFQTRRESIILLFGDLVIFVASLWLMLFIRYLEVPSKSLFLEHIYPFSFLFIVWVVVFFIAGLYEKHTTVLRGKLSSVILNAQITNIFVAIVFFYIIPYFGITPKTNLFVYLVISLPLVLIWRLNGYKFTGFKKRQKAILLGKMNKEMEELRKEIEGNNRYPFSLDSVIDVDDLDSIDFQEEVVKRVYSEDISFIITDLKSEKVKPILPNLYNLIFSGIRFVDMYHVYEDIFDRVPLSLLKYNWFLENISAAPETNFDMLKRGVDVTLALFLGIFTVILYPIVFIALKIEDGGPVIFSQDRVGWNNGIIKILKFRSMKDGKVTKVGGFLRKTRIDEFPQFWNVLKGELSLIGPRPEIPHLVEEYQSQIPYYGIRHLIKPGLSGWAQIYHNKHPHHESDVEETRVKLSYDLFYIKNKSYILDLKIALKTLRQFTSRAGR